MHSSKLECDRATLSVCTAAISQLVVQSVRRAYLWGCAALRAWSAGHGQLLTLTHHPRSAIVSVSRTRPTKRAASKEIQPCRSRRIPRSPASATNPIVNPRPIICSAICHQRRRRLSQCRRDSEPHPHHDRRRSGKPYSTPLYFGEHAGRYVLVASYAGSDTHPKWYLNLREHPEVEVQVRGERFAARAGRQRQRRSRCCGT